MSDPGAGRWTLGGAAVLMACACATSTQTAKAVSLTGFGATTTMVHPVFIGIGAAIVLYGLARKAPRSAVLALAGFALLAIAAALAPPRIMASASIPGTASR